VIKISEAVNFADLVREADVREHLADADDDVPNYFDALNSSPPSPEAPSSSPAPSTPPPMPKGPFVTKPSPQPIEKLRRKVQGNKRCALRRAMEKDAADHGVYSIKPALVNKHIRTAQSISTPLNVSKLRHTNTAYGGIAGESGDRVYRLEELIGENSHFKFKLQRWDGR
jgi:hypothetical protein